MCSRCSCRIQMTAQCLTTDGYTRTPILSTDLLPCCATLLCNGKHNGISDAHTSMKMHCRCTEKWSPCKFSAMPQQMWAVQAGFPGTGLWPTPLGYQIGPERLRRAFTFSLELAGVISLILALVTFGQAALNPGLCLGSTGGQC